MKDKKLIGDFRSGERGTPMSFSRFSFKPDLEIKWVRPLKITLLVIVMVLSGAKAWHDSGASYFFSDDFLNFIFVRDLGFSWAYLSRGAQGEFIPLYRVGNLIYYDLFGLSFLPFRLLLVVYQLAVIFILAKLAWERLIRIEFLLPCLMLIALSPIYVTPYQWWSSALNVLGECLACLGAIAIMARPGRMGITRQCAATALYVAGLLFFPKALFVASILLAIRVFSWVREENDAYRSAFLKALKETWPIFLTGSMYLGCVLAGHYDSGAVRPGFLLVLKYIWHGWNHGFLTGVLGLDRGFFGRVAMANTLVAVVVLLTAVRSRGAWLVWLGFLIYFVFALGVTAVNRAVPFGLESAEWSRYYADILVFFMALLIIAWRPIDKVPYARSNPYWLLLSIILTVFAAIHLGEASARVPLLWPIPPTQTKGFLANVERSLSHVGPETRIANTIVPAWILPQWTEPQNQYRYFLLLFGRSWRVVPVENSNAKFDQDGKLMAQSTQSIKH